MRRPLFLSLLLLLLIVGAVLAWLQYRNPAPAAPAEPLAAATAPPAPPPSPAPTPRAEHPIDAVRERLAEPAAPSGPTNLEAEVKQLFGRAAALKLLQLDDLPHRLVATVDNLGRRAAPARLWPVNPTPGHFKVREQGGHVTIDPDNGLRYAAFVQLVESVEPRSVVALYLRFYPQLQEAYEGLGFPGQHFNTRLVEVIDQLLATPRPAGPIEVALPVVQGGPAPLRPWVLYDFVDPALQDLNAGQRWLLRLGPVNQRRLQQRLVAYRALLANTPLPEAASATR